MIDPELMGLAYLAIKALTTGRHELNARKLLAELLAVSRDVKALKQHVGIDVDESGRVIVLRRPAAAALEYQDEVAKP